MIAATSPRLDARGVASPPPPPTWPLSAMKLADLPPAARISLGRALDGGAVRLVLGDNGDVYAVAGRAGR